MYVCMYGYVHRKRIEGCVNSLKLVLQFSISIFVALHIYDFNFKLLSPSGMPKPRKDKEKRILQ
jgi:hypothetical protein